MLEQEIMSVKYEYFNLPSNYTPYKASFMIQMVYLLQRSFSNYFRNYKVVITDLLMVIVTAILGGLIFYQSYDRDSNDQCWFDQRNSFNIGFALFYTLTVTVIVSMLAAVLAFPIGNFIAKIFFTKIN